MSAHCEAEERGRPRTSRLGGIHFVGDNHDHEGAVLISSSGGQEDEEGESNEMALAVMIISCGAKVKTHLSTCRLNIDEIIMTRFTLACLSFQTGYKREDDGMKRIFFLGSRSSMAG